MNNSLIIQKFTFRKVFSNQILFTCQSHICWLDAIRLGSSREAHIILIEMVKINKTHTHTYTHTHTHQTLRDTVFFIKKITASVTKSSHQDRGPCYLHLPIFFLYIHSLLLLGNKKMLLLLFSSEKLDHRPLFNDIYYDTILVWRLVHYD